MHMHDCAGMDESFEREGPIPWYVTVDVGVARLVQTDERGETVASRAIRYCPWCGEELGVPEEDPIAWDKLVPPMTEDEVSAWLEKLEGAYPQIMGALRRIKGEWEG